MTVRNVLVYAVVVWAALAVVPVGSTAWAQDEPAAPVIAAPPAGDQPPVETAVLRGEAGRFTVADAVMLGLAALSLGIFFGARLWRLPRHSNRPEAFPPVVGVALYIAIYLAAILGALFIAPAFVSESFDAADPAFQDSVIVQACAYLLQCLVAIVFFVLVLRAATQSTEQRSRLWVAGMLGGAALLLTWPVSQAVAAAAGFVQTLLTDEPIRILAHETLREMLERPADGWFFAQAVLVIVFAPVLEEVLYRGIFQETLRRLGLGAWPAILGTSIFFAAMHWTVVEIHALVSLAVLSIGFGWIYEKTGRLTAPIVMHALFNAGNLGIAMLASQTTSAAALLP